MQKGQQMLARCPKSAETNIDQDINNLKDKWESVKSKLSEKKVRTSISTAEQHLVSLGPGLCFISGYQESDFHDLCSYFCIYLVFYEVKHSILTQENRGTVQDKDLSQINCYSVCALVIFKILKHSSSRLWIIVFWSQIRWKRMIWLYLGFISISFISQLIKLKHTIFLYRPNWKRLST